jgi:DNA transformation protein
VRDASFRDFVLDQLAGLDGLACRAMFGGHGLYLDGEFFGMIWKGRLWFRTDAKSRGEYRALGSLPIPFGGDPSGNSYWSVPEDVLEEGPRLEAWARTAAATPRPAARTRRRRKGRGKRKRTGEGEREGSGPRARKPPRRRA